MNRLDEALRAAGGGPLLGMSVHRYDPAFVEMLGLLGVHAVWIEQEHAAITVAEACDLCRAAKAAGILAMIRIPDARRESVLKAAECGPDILDLPMANTPEMLRDLVRHARYAPAGERGFFGGSRAVRYGFAGSIVDEQRRINRELCLMAQIETREAVARADELCAVPGIDAFFLGPGDLSASLGVTGEVSHPKVRAAGAKALAAARRHGKRAAVACRPVDAAFWASQGADLLFVGSDIACLKTGAKILLEETGLAGASARDRGVNPKQIRIRKK